MVGITDSLRIAMSGLKLAQDSLATTSNNVANVHTEGYTRKRVEQEARVVGGRGVGVREVEIARDVDQFLERQLRIQQSKLGRSQTIDAYAQDVQGLVFGNPSEDATGLGSVVDNLARKLEAAAAKPEDGARRSAVVWAAQDVFNELSGAADQAQILRRDADRRIAGLVGEVNTTLQSIDDLNTDIVRSPEDAELLDQRDRLVKELSYKLDITTYTHDDNRIAIFTEHGQALLEYEPRMLDYAPTASMGRGAVLDAIEIFTPDQIDPADGEPYATAHGEALVGGGTRAEATPASDSIRPTVTGGELGGLLEVRDRVLPELDDQLREFGAVLRHQLDAAHNGANAYPPTGQLAGARTRADLTTPAPTTFAGTAYVQVTDPGGATTTHALDLGTVTNVDDLVGDLDGLADVTASLPGGAGDTLSLQVPAGYTIALADGTVSGTPAAATITQDDGRGHALSYGLSHFFGLNDFVTKDATTGELAVRDDLAADPQKIASAKLDVSAGPPPSGTLGGVGDSRGLGDLAAALDAPMDTVGRGGLPDATLSAREYLSDVTSVQAMRAAGAERTAKNDAVLAEELDFQKAGISGVNLDEEMAHLLQLQQAYSTSARLLTTADEMLQDLLNAKR
ncbi:MAG: flagellar hook-associated protein FlgK [Deinococcus-Thermus bacterium]|jgi:flagellar hook-associated protein 1 FlgK|nr:flagellar hook-associated protein FlgK [Deinococcota bacterium]